MHTGASQTESNPKAGRQSIFSLHVHVYAQLKVKVIRTENKFIVFHLVFLPARHLLNSHTHTHTYTHGTCRPLHPAAETAVCITDKTNRNTLIQG